jgi:hypothetical protein
MQPGEIYLARFPFGDVPGMKLRPVLLLTGSIGPGVFVRVKFDISHTKIVGGRAFLWRREFNVAEGGP